MTIEEPYHVQSRAYDSRAVIQMASGTMGAFMLTISGIIADELGVATMLLILIPLPTIINIILWLPIFRTYSDPKSVVNGTLTNISKADMMRNE